MRDKATLRAVGRHVARFILVGLYTGTRSAAICGAALMPTVGRGHVDLEQGRVLSPRHRPPADQEAAAAGQAAAAPACPHAPLGRPWSRQEGGGRVEWEVGRERAQGLRSGCARPLGSVPT